MQNKAAKALNAGIKNSYPNTDESSFSNNSSSTKDDDLSSSEEVISSADEESSQASSKSEVSKLPTFEFFLDQEELGTDDFVASYTPKSTSLGDGVSSGEPRSYDISDIEETDDEYSTFAREKDPPLNFSFEEEELGIEDNEYEYTKGKDPPLNFSFEEEELGIEDTEYEYTKENSYFPYQGSKDIIINSEEEELDLRRRDVQTVDNDQKNEDCLNPIVVCLIQETIASVTSQFTK